MLGTRFIQRIAEETAVKAEQAATAIKLFDEGATIPFVARYRKDVTGILDEATLEAIAEHNTYFTALTSRRNAILEALAKQGQFTEDLRSQLESCYDIADLEELYLPYKKRRRTKATTARDQGLGPLADFLWGQVPSEQTVEEVAANFVRPEKVVHSVEEALEGARHILVERIALDAEIRKVVRERMLREGQIVARATKNAEGKKTKFEAYYDFTEPLVAIPSHRLLAVLRGSKEGILRTELSANDDHVMSDIMTLCVKERGSAFEPYIHQAVEEAYRLHLRAAIEHEVFGIVRRRAEDEAIKVFRENARNLLLSAPAGPIPVIGVDPSVHNGCRLAVVDKVGTFLESATFFLKVPQDDAANAESMLLALMQRHEVYAIAIRNGSGARETARFINSILAKLGKPEAFSVLVNESGASIYSSSKVARDEFPDIDSATRSAISIARRLQDPLAELVKIEPRNIGVGQYQHDVNQKRLRESLHRIVVSCVNRVGVDLNTASVSLLRYVSGLHLGTAQNIVEARGRRGRFTRRDQLLEVDGVGPKVYEQCAGFLRIRAGENVLDASAIHPEAYPVVEGIAAALGLPVDGLLNNPDMLRGMDLGSFHNDIVGPHTLEDIRAELMRPGRDPRRAFKLPKFLEGVSSISDLQEGMETEGVVTNVTDFGAFVDIGVQQDGLVHLSELTTRYIQDPQEVVKVGDIVRVKIIRVDKELPRISLSMKALAPATRGDRKGRRRRARKQEPYQKPAMAAPSAESRARTDRPAGPRSDERRKPGEKRGQRRREVVGAKAKRQGSPPPRDKRAQQTSEAGGRLNTLLAEQLAALKDKFRR